MNKLLFRTVFFCLSVLSLCSCRQDDETDRSNESGDLVAVNIPIEGVRVESADSPLTRGGSADTLTVTEELEDGFILETSLMPVSEGLTRTAITTGLASDVQILAIAYKESGELYKYQYLTPGSPIIHLPKGERFKLVFYSYNSTAKPDISGNITGYVTPVTNGAIFSKTASLNDKSEIYTNNVMWGRIDLTPVITSGVSLSGVTFTHLFSRLDWRLQSVVGPITECSGRIRNTYKDATIKLGNLVNTPAGSNGTNIWVGSSNADYAATVTFNSLGSTDITSLKTVFCPNAGQEIILALNKITVGGKTFAGQRHTFPTKLKRGVEYRALSTIKRRMTVTFRAAKGGTVTPEGAQTVTSYGKTLTSTARADAALKFMGWYRNGSKLENSANEKINGNSVTITVNEITEGKTYEARFGEPEIEWSPGNLEYRNGEYIFNNNDAGAPGTTEGLYWFPGSDLPWGPATAPNTLGKDPCRHVRSHGGRWRLPNGRDARGTTNWKVNGDYVSFISAAAGGRRVKFKRSAPFNAGGELYTSDYILYTETDVKYNAIWGLLNSGVPAVIARWYDEPQNNTGWVYSYKTLVGRTRIRCVRYKK